jgi:hypothetical protein
VDIKEKIFGDQENYGFAKDVKATDLFYKAKKKKNKAEKEEDNKKSHAICNKRSGGGGKETLYL